MSKVSGLPVTTTGATSIKLYASNAGVDEALPVSVLLGGYAGGKTLTGGNSSAENLTLRSTEHATLGLIKLGLNSAYDEANDRLGIGTTSPAVALEVSSSTSRFRLTDTDGATDEKSIDFINLNGDIIVRGLKDAGGTAGVNQLRLEGRTAEELTAMRFGSSTGVWTFVAQANGHVLTLAPTSAIADGEFQSGQIGFYTAVNGSDRDLLVKHYDGTTYRTGIVVTMT